ncbi:hypothetical protein [Sphingomonas humi]
MLAPALLTAFAATAQAPAAPPLQVRAQTQVFVQIIQAAEIRDGSSGSPHQRTTRTDDAGRTQILLQFE